MHRTKLGSYLYNLNVHPLTIAGFKNIKSGFEGRKKQSQTSYFNPLSEVYLDAK